MPDVNKLLNNAIKETGIESRGSFPCKRFVQRL